ncbi:MAG: RING finger protein [Promethearchaeota archaeon]
MLKLVKDLINQIHDLSNKKEEIINDTNYRKYLPLGHKILKGFYQIWIIMMALSLIVGFLHKTVDETFKTLILYIVIATFLLSLLILLMSVILYAIRYTVPIAVTNEIKAKKVMHINSSLKELKAELEKNFKVIIIKEFIHAGKFDPENVRGSISIYVKTNFPHVQYINDIFNDEILEILEKETGVYIIKFSLQLKGKIKNHILNITALSDELGVAPSFIMQMFEYLIERGEIAGEFSPDGRVFIPAGYVPEPDTLTEDQLYVENNPIDAPSSEPPPQPSGQPGAQPSAQPSTSGADSSEPVANQSTPALNTTAAASAPGSALEAAEVSSQQLQPLNQTVLKTKAQISTLLDSTGVKIENLKESYEEGAIGVDGYVNQLEELERELNFLRIALDLRENVEDPETHCIVCYKKIELGDILVKCPNDHAFHRDCAHDYLQKRDRCPWCNVKIKNLDHA